MPEDDVCIEVLFVVFSLLAVAAPLIFMPWYGVCDVAELVGADEVFGRLLLRTSIASSPELRLRPLVDTWDDVCESET